MNQVLTTSKRVKAYSVDPMNPQWQGSEWSHEFEDMSARGTRLAYQRLILKRLREKVERSGTGAQKEELDSFLRLATRTHVFYQLPTVVYVPKAAKRSLAHVSKKVRIRVRLRPK